MKQAILTTLILFGKYLEARAKSQTTNALGELLSLQAKEARILKDGNEVMIPLNEVHVEIHLSLSQVKRYLLMAKLLKV